MTVAEGGHLSAMLVVAILVQWSAAPVSICRAWISCGEYLFQKGTRPLRPRGMGLWKTNNQRPSFASMSAASVSGVDELFIACFFAYTCYA